MLFLANGGECLHQGLLLSISNVWKDLTIRHRNTTTISGAATTKGCFLCQQVLQFTTWEKFNKSTGRLGLHDIILIITSIWQADLRDVQYPQHVVTRLYSGHIIMLCIVRNSATQVKLHCWYHPHVVRFSNQSLSATWERVIYPAFI